MEGKKGKKRENPLLGVLWVLSLNKRLTSNLSNVALINSITHLNNSQLHQNLFPNYLQLPVVLTILCSPTNHKHSIVLQFIKQNQIASICDFTHLWGTNTCRWYWHLTNADEYPVRRGFSQAVIGLERKVYYNPITLSSTSFNSQNSLYLFQPSWDVPNLQVFFCNYPISLFEDCIAHCLLLHWQSPTNTVINKTPTTPKSVHSDKYPSCHRSQKNLTDYESTLSGSIDKKCLSCHSFVFLKKKKHALWMKLVFLMFCLSF